KSSSVDLSLMEEALAYVRAHPQIREVILSGGEPLVLSVSRLEALLRDIKAIPHVKWIRIHTKMPCVDPEQVTDRLASVLASFAPLYIHVHFNHPRELTCQATEALQRLRRAGIPLGAQTVLLKGVNDDV